MTAARLPGLFKLSFVGWFIVMHAVGWVFLWRAAVTLAASWQDQPHAQAREPEPAEGWPTRVSTAHLAVTTTEDGGAGVRPSSGAATSSSGRVSAPSNAQSRSDIAAPEDGRTPPLLAAPAATPEPVTVLTRASWLTDPRPWDADPIRWRVERLGSVEGLLWLAVALNFLAQFGTLGSILNFGAGPADTWGLVSFVGMAVILFSGGLIAWAGARFFQDTRRQQDLELLLTTPLGSRQILDGQWCVLRQALKWPLGVVLVLALPTGISLIYDFTNGYRRELWSQLQPFLIAVNIALEAVALCWVGMRFGLRGRNSITAVVGTVGLVQLLPLVLAVALMWGWAWLSGHSSSLTTSRGKMPPVILALLFFLAKNLALIVWVRLRLRRELRLGRQKARPDASASRLVLQRA
jgi:hypothetical protein